MIAGEVIYFYSCRPVFVYIREENKCTQELPVTYQNQSYFVLPFTRILVEEAASTPCASMAPPQYLFGGTMWVTYKGGVTGDPPRYLDPQDPVWDLGFVELEKRRAFGFYTPAQLAEAHRAMLFPRTHDFVVQKIVSEGTSNFQSPVWRAERLLDEHFHENLAKRFLTRMWGAFAVVGNFISGVLGIYFCYQVVRIALGQVIQMYNVYQIVGFTRDFILSWIPIVGKHVLISNLRKRSEYWKAKDFIALRSKEEIRRTSEEKENDYAEEPAEERSEKKEEKIYPVAHMNGMSLGMQPSTNAIKINGCTVSTLIDTGSCCTIINISSFPEDTRFPNLEPYVGSEIKSASGHKVHTPMQGDVYLVIGSIILKHKVIITDGMPHDCVLGMDWLERM